MEQDNLLGTPVMNLPTMEMEMNFMPTLDIEEQSQESLLDLSENSI